MSPYQSSAFFALVRSARAALTKPSVRQQLITEAWKAAVEHHKSYLCTIPAKSVLQGILSEIDAALALQGQDNLSEVEITDLIHTTQSKAWFRNAYSSEPEVAQEEPGDPVPESKGTVNDLISFLGSKSAPAPIAKTTRKETFSMDVQRAHLYTKTPEGKVMDAAGIEIQRSIVTRWRQRHVVSLAFTILLPATVLMGASTVLWLALTMPFMPHTFVEFLMHAGAWLGGGAVIASGIAAGHTILNGRISKMREVSNAHYKAELNRLRELQGDAPIDFDWWDKPVK